MSKFSRRLQSSASHNTVLSSSMPVGDLPGWTQILAEDFTTPAALGQVGAVYGASLRGYDVFSDTSGKGVYSPDLVLSVSNSILDYYIHTEGGQPRGAAPVMNNYNGQTYGRYSLRFRCDHLPSYKIAFLLWPASNDWNEGEIDWPEGVLGEAMRPASARKGTYTNGNVLWDPPVLQYAPTTSLDWHIATTEWTPGSIKWYWDGALLSQTTIPAGVPTTDFNWILQAETNNDTSNPVNTSESGHVQVDWAVAYSYSP